MLAILFTLLGCAAAPASPTDDLASLAPPAPWYYYDMGDAIDWDSLRFLGREVAFRTRGGALESGPVPDGPAWADALACGQATRATLLFREGRLDDVVTVPEAPCVEAIARTLGLSGMRLGAVPVVATGQAVIALDVPEVPTCSRSC